MSPTGATGATGDARLLRKNKDRDAGNSLKGARFGPAMNTKITDTDAILLLCAMPSHGDGSGFMVATGGRESASVLHALARLDGLLVIEPSGRNLFAKRTAAGDAALTDGRASKAAAARRAISAGAWDYEMGKPCPSGRLAAAGWLFAKEAQLGDDIEIGWGAGGDLRGIELQAS